MKPEELSILIEGADWANAETKRLAVTLVELWAAVEENQRATAVLPWRFSSENGLYIQCDREMFRGWMLGASTKVDLVLSKLRTIKP